MLKNIKHLAVCPACNKSNVYRLYLRDGCYVFRCNECGAEVFGAVEYALEVKSK